MNNLFLKVEHISLYDDRPSEPVVINVNEIRMIKPVKVGDQDFRAIIYLKKEGEEMLDFYITARPFDEFMRIIFQESA